MPIIDIDVLCMKFTNGTFIYSHHNLGTFTSIGNQHLIQNHNG